MKDKTVKMFYLSENIQEFLKLLYEHGHWYNLLHVEGITMLIL